MRRLSSAATERKSEIARYLEADWELINQERFNNPL